METQLKSLSINDSKKIRLLKKYFNPKMSLGLTVMRNDKKKDIKHCIM